jgi:hypothetical protein
MNRESSWCMSWILVCKALSGWLTHLVTFSSLLNSCTKRSVFTQPLIQRTFAHQCVQVPNAAGDAPVPVLHSPPRKLTPQDHDDWKIPPCISQWKNTKVQYL